MRKNNRKPIILNNGKKFNSKTDCNKYFSGILKYTKVNSKVDKKYHNDVLFLFTRHPKYKRLSEFGIEFIYVGKDTYGYRCFFVKLGSGWSDSFSIKKCIDAKDDSCFSKFQQCCRYSIMEQIIKFKFNKIQEDGTFVSDISGDLIHKEYAHVDHVYEFVNIVIDFINKNRIDIYNVGYDSSIPMTMRFSDESMSKKFYEYHLNNATLRIVSAKENSIRKRNNMKTKYDIVQ